MQDPMAALVPFQYESTEVRVLTLGDEPWFVASDIARVLEFRDSHNLIRGLDEEDKGTTKVSTPGGPQEMSVVSEAGLYTAIVRSNAERVRPFRRWITAEVLPSIRRSGGYGNASLSGPELMAAALVEAQAVLEAKDAQIAVLEPKAELADSYLTANAGSRLVGEAAKILEMKEKELRAFLLSEGMIFVRHAVCGNIQYDFRAQFAPHFEARETVVNHTWGSCNHYTLRITPRGIELIRKRLRHLQVVPA